MPFFCAAVAGVAAVCVPVPVPELPLPLPLSLPLVPSPPEPFPYPGTVKPFVPPLVPEPPPGSVVVPCDWLDVVVVPCEDSPSAVPPAAPMIASAATPEPMTSPSRRGRFAPGWFAVAAPEVQPQGVLPVVVPAVPVVPVVPPRAALPIRYGPRPSGV